VRERLRALDGSIGTGDKRPVFDYVVDERASAAAGRLMLRRDAAGDGTGWRFGGYRLQQEPGR
jgi:hypothetical protein